MQAILVRQYPVHLAIPNVGGRGLELLRDAVPYRVWGGWVQSALYAKELQAERMSCQTTNLSGERVFARVDAAMRKAPNISVAKAESKLMYQCNHTAEWLNQKGPQEKAETIDAAHRQSHKIGTEGQRWNQVYKEKVKEKLCCKQKELSEKDQKWCEVTERTIEDLDGGLWDVTKLDEHL